MSKRFFICAAMLFVASTGCGLLGGGGLESKECKDYFAKVEECASKANAKGTPSGKVKADAWKKGAEVSKQNWEKNANPVAVKKGCEIMAEQLKNDSDCR
jgi:hypothetical protein